MSEGVEYGVGGGGGEAQSDFVLQVHIYTFVKKFTFLYRAQFYIQHEAEVECVSNLRLTQDRSRLEFCW